jgi:hypothetical protein
MMLAHLRLAQFEAPPATHIFVTMLAYVAVFA